MAIVLLNRVVYTHQARYVVRRTVLLTQRPQISACSATLRKWCSASSGRLYPRHALPLPELSYYQRVLNDIRQYPPRSGNHELGVMKINLTSSPNSFSFLIVPLASSAYFSVTLAGFRFDAIETSDFPALLLTGP